MQGSIELKSDNIYKIMDKIQKPKEIPESFELK